MDALGDDAKWVSQLCCVGAFDGPPELTSAPPARNSLLQWYSLQLLRDYRRIFGSTSEAGQLDNATRRFAWFRRVLKTHEDDSGLIFPKHWHVGAVLAGGFGEVTRDDLKSVLAKNKSTLQVGLLLEVLQLTTEFEREMSRKYSLPVSPLHSPIALFPVPGMLTFAVHAVRDHLGYVSNQHRSGWPTGVDLGRV